jgi:hypothetical protein
MGEKWKYNGTVQYSTVQYSTDFEEAYNSVTGEVLYNILIEFCIHMKLGGLIKICLNKC